MKRYIVDQFTGSNVSGGRVNRAIQEFLDRNPDYDLDQMTSATVDGYISVVVVLKLRED